jgi:hypothetical protein
MNQQTFLSQAGFEKYGRKSRREMVLDEMELVPWAELQTMIEPHYAKAGDGQRPVGLSIMLRIYFFAAVIQSIRLWRGGGVVRVFRTAAVYGAWTLVARQLRTRRRSADSAIFWRSMNGAVRC